jgi:hypothetical protein
LVRIRIAAANGRLDPKATFIQPLIRQGADRCVFDCVRSTQ